MAPLSSESICLLNALRDALHKRDFVTFVNYANGEHAILTDAGLDFGGPQ